MSAGAGGKWSRSSDRKRTHCKINTALLTDIGRATSPVKSRVAAAAVAAAAAAAAPPTHPILLSGPYFSLSLSRLHCTLPTLGLCNLEDYRKDCLWLDKTARKWVGRREGGKRKTNKEKIKEMNWLAGTDLSSLKLEASLWCWADRKRMAEEPKWLRLDVDDEPLVDVKGSTAPSSERWGLNMLLVVVVPVVVEGMREAAERAAPGPVR